MEKKGVERKSTSILDGAQVSLRSTVSAWRWPKEFFMCLQAANILSGRLVEVGNSEVLSVRFKLFVQVSAEGYEMGGPGDQSQDFLVAEYALNNQVFAVAETGTADNQSLEALGDGSLWVSTVPKGTGFMADTADLLALCLCQILRSSGKKVVQNLTPELERAKKFVNLKV